MAVVTIVGAGMMGSAMSRPATDNGHEVRLAGTPLDGDIIRSVRADGYHPTLKCAMPEGVAAYEAEGLDAALRGADWIIGGASSFGVDWFAESVLPRLASGARVLLITKGLADADAVGGLRPFPRHLAALRPDVDFLAVGGPCICFELMARRQTMVCFCGETLDRVREARALLATSYYHIVPTTDVVGVECGAALKNAYAMGVSLAIGLAEREADPTDATDAGAACIPGAPDRNPVFNPQAALFAQSCLEMRRFLRLMGGCTEWIGGLPGAGDLYVTVFGGRTRRLGTLLGRGLSYPEARKVLSDVTLEAVGIITRVAEALRRRAEQGRADLGDFPFLLHMDAILNRGTPVSLDWERFGPRDNDDG